MLFSKYTKDLIRSIYRQTIESLVILYLLFGFQILSGQNLINNPGFETGITGWSGFWSRDGLGSAEIESDTVHSGERALHILYNGTEDWAISNDSSFRVIPGDLVELSAWSLVDSINSYAEFSVELLDSSKSVIDWNFGSCLFAKGSDTFNYFSNRFIIPPNVSYMIPRLVGGDFCNIYIDDLSLVIDSNVIKKDNKVVLDNDTLQVSISFPSMIISAFNRLTNITYNTDPKYEYTVISVDSTTKNQLQINAQQIFTNNIYIFSYSLAGNSLTINISSDTSQSMNDTLQFPGAIDGNSGEYIVIPRATGLLWPNNATYPFYDYSMYAWKSTMAFVGVTNITTGYMIVSENPWDTEVMIQNNGSDSLLSPSLIHHPSKGKLGYTRTMHYVFVQNSYTEMCQWYKNYTTAKGYRKTFDAKAQDNPNMNLLEGAIDFWVINMGFEESDIDTFIMYGLDKAIISLSGYEDNISSLIDYINENGFLSSRYDIYTDVYPPDEFPNLMGYRRTGYPADIIVQSNGTLFKGWLAYVNGLPFQSYTACSKTHAAFADSVISNELLTRKYNARFIDVELAGNLDECYSAVHPVTRQTDAQARDSLLNLVKNKFSLVTGSEEARDFAFPNVDFGEGTMTMFPQVNSGYDWFDPIDTIGNYYALYNVNPAIRIPLHGLIYHDVHVPTWYTGDGVSKVPAYWDDKDLFNILYASMPLFMPPSRDYWNSNLEKFLTSYHLVSSITRLAGFEEMTGHSFLSSDKLVQQTTFANNWKITANFSSSPALYGSKNLAPKGFYASNGSEYEVFKCWVSNSALAVAYTNNRMFVNPYDSLRVYKGVKTSGPVFLRNDSDKVHVAIIGNENTITINSALMPWEMGHAYSELTGDRLTYTNVGGGWITFNIPSGEKFIYFAHDTIDLPFYKVKQGLPVFDFYPNPARSTLQLEATVSHDQNTKITLTNILGQPVKELMNSMVLAGTNVYTFDISEIEKGIYLIVIESNSSIKPVKILIQ